jgi:nucleoside-diphosphate-sugar epimerase
VDDLIRGLVLLAESDVHEPVNLGNPVEMTLLEMAELIVELTESGSEIVLRRCRSTTRRCDSPTPPEPNSCSAGNPRSRCESYGALSPTTPPWS